MDYKVSIEELENTPSKTLEIHFEEKIVGLNCVTPVVADLTVMSLGEFVEVRGNVKGAVTLECDLCLKEFEYKFDGKLTSKGKKLIKPEFKNRLYKWIVI